MLDGVEVYSLVDYCWKEERQVVTPGMLLKPGAYLIMPWTTDSGLKPPPSDALADPEIWLDQPSLNAVARELHYRYDIDSDHVLSPATEVSISLHLYEPPCPLHTLTILTRLNPNQSTVLLLETGYSTDLESAVADAESLVAKYDSGCGGLSIRGLAQMLEEEDAWRTLLQPLGERVGEWKCGRVGVCNVCERVVPTQR